MWNQRREGEWKRLHELAAILYNKDGESGLWSQVLAVEELKRLRTRRKEVLELAHAAAIQFSSLPQTPETKGLYSVHVRTRKLRTSETPPVSGSPR